MKPLTKLTGIVNLKPLREFDEGGDDVDPMSFHTMGGMTKAQLMQIHTQASHLFNMLGDNDEIDEWAQNMIAKAFEAINTVHSYVSYEKNNGNTIGDGEGASATAPAGRMQSQF